MNTKMNFMLYRGWVSLGFLIVGAIVISILESLVGPIFGLLFIGVILFGIYFIYSIINPVVVIYLAIFISGLSGSLSLIHYDVLPVSLSGLLTAILLASTLIAILSRINYQSTFNAVKAYWYFYPFISFLFLRAITSQFFVDGLRLFFLVVTPILVGILARREMFRNFEARGRIEKALLMIPLIPIGIILINIIGGTIQISSLGFSTVIGLGLGPRPLALLLLPILALLVSRWRYSKKKRDMIIGVLGTITITAIIITSLSRVASVIALLIVLPSRFIKRWYNPKTIITIIIGSGLLIYWLSLPSVKTRFFSDQFSSFNINIGSFRAIDTQGRTNLWKLTWNNSFDSPLFGNGTGSAGKLINLRYPPLEHPHNDYLRIFHDTGIIGLILFLWAWLYQLYHNWTYWIILDKRRNFRAYYHLASLVGTIAICISFLTDNTLTYVFVLIPLFIIYGLADSGMKEDTYLNSPLQSGMNESIDCS